MRLIFLHTYAQMQFQWVIIVVLVLGTIVALLMEPASAVLRRWRTYRQQPIRPALCVLVLVLLGGSALLFILMRYGIFADTIVSAIESFGSLLARLNAPERFVVLVQTAPSQPLAIAEAACVAVGLGAAHALTPGHSKTLVAAYLVGTRGSSAQALLLGLSVTVTHTAGVFVLGGVSLVLTRFITLEHSMLWVEVAAGTLVVLLGGQLLYQRLRPSFTHNHTHPHEHGPHTHTHLPAQKASRRSWLMLGIAGGLVPCPSALVLLLTAIGLGRAGLGLLLTAAFSVGLASVLTGVGLLFVHGQRWLHQRDGFVYAPQLNAVRRMMPVASAIFVTIIGVGITLSALAQTGALH